MEENTDTLPEIEPYSVDSTDTSANLSSDSGTSSFDPNADFSGGDYYEEIGSEEEVSGGKKKFPLFFLAVIGLVIIGAILLMFLILSSPSKKPSTNNNTDGTSTGAVFIDWWGSFVPEDAVQPLIDEYKTLKPNVTITYKNNWQASLPYREAESEYRSRLNEVLLGEQINQVVQTPDIFMVKGSWVGDYEAYSSPSTTITKEQFANDYYDSLVTEYTKPGAVVGLPLWLDTLAIIYNKDMISASNSNVTSPPTAWEEFRSFAENLTIKEGNTIKRAGFAAGTPENTSFGFELFNILMMQNGVTITDPVTGNPNLATQETTIGSAFDFYKSFSNNLTWNSNFKNDAAAFLDEDVAMIVGTSWRLRDILRFNEQKGLGLDIGVSGVPQLAGQSQAIINWGESWGNIVSKSRPNASASWEFIEWLNQPEQQKKLHDNIKEKAGYFGQIYPRKDMASELQNDKYLAEFNKVLEFTKTWYMVKGIEVNKSFDTFLALTSVNSIRLQDLQRDIITQLTAKGQLEK